MKQYKYIWQDKQKQWWIAIENWNNYLIWIEEKFKCIRRMIENEPTIWEEIKEENLLWNAIVEYMEIKDKKQWASLDDLEYVIKKHLWITEDELQNKVCTSCDWLLIKDVIELFKKRGLYIENNKNERNKI